MLERDALGEEDSIQPRPDEAVREDDNGGQKAAAALSFQHEIRDAVEANRQRAEYVERGYEIYPIVGIQQPTFRSARPAHNGVDLLRTYKGEDQRGDGTVRRVSAMPIEMHLMRYALDAWRTSCPRLPVWEDSVDRGFVVREHTEGLGVMIKLTPLGRRFLCDNGRMAGQSRK